MPSGKYFLIQIGSVYLTHDGTETGDPCLTVIPQAGALYAGETGNTTIGNDGAPFNELPAQRAPVLFEIQITNIKTAVYSTLRAELAALDLNEEINIKISGEPGDVDLQAVKWYNPENLTFGSFTEGFIKNIVARFAVTEFN